MEVLLICVGGEVVQIGELKACHYRNLCTENLFEGIGDAEHVGSILQGKFADTFYNAIGLTGEDGVVFVVLDAAIDFQAEFLMGFRDGLKEIFLIDGYVVMDILRG